MTDNEPRVIEVSPLQPSPPRILEVGEFPAPRVLEVLKTRERRGSRWSSLWKKRTMAFVFVASLRIPPTPTVVVLSLIQLLLSLTPLLLLLKFEQRGERDER
ncbi:MAG: hypothetical protein QXJ49_07110 [Nitrososphaerota archaeon]